MAQRPNKFKELYKTRKETTNLTEDLVDQLYEHEEKQESLKAEPPKTISKAVEEPAPVQTVVSTKPKKVGRPRKTEEERSMFNFRISDSRKEMITVASSAKGMSMTDYIEMLIEQDYIKNKEYYDLVKANMKR